jgi:hypothetical protein
MSLQLEHCEQSTYCFDILGLVVNVGRGAKVQGLTGWWWRRVETETSWGVVGVGKRVKDERSGRSLLNILI